MMQNIFTFMLILQISIVIDFGWIISVFPSSLFTSTPLSKSPMSVASTINTLVFALDIPPIAHSFSRSDKKEQHHYSDKVEEPFYSVKGEINFNSGKKGDENISLFVPSSPQNIISIPDAPLIWSIFTPTVNSSLTPSFSSQDSNQFYLSELGRDKFEPSTIKRRHSSSKGSRKRYKRKKLRDGRKLTNFCKDLFLCTIMHDNGSDEERKKSCKRADVKIWCPKTCGECQVKSKIPKKINSCYEPLLDTLIMKPSDSKNFICPIHLSDRGHFTNMNGLFTNQMCHKKNSKMKIDNAAPVHIVPHIGSLGGTFQSSESIRKRKAPEPNVNYKEEQRKTLGRLQALTYQKAQEIHFFDKKSQVRRSLSTYLTVVKRMGIEELAFYLVGDIGNSFDNIITVWKEKVKYNLIRPTEVIKGFQRAAGVSKLKLWPKGVVYPESYDSNMNPIPNSGYPIYEYKSNLTESYASVERIKNYSVSKNADLEEIELVNFEPLIRTMPHAEYPSGSACICQGIKEFAEVAFEFLLEDNEFGDGTFIPLETHVILNASDMVLTHMIWHKNTVNNLPKSYTLDEMNRACGESRLNAGFHFDFSVSMGRQLCKGQGNEGKFFYNIV